MAQESDKKKKETPECVLSKELDTPGIVAFNYGFTPINTPKITDEDRSKAKQWKSADTFSGESEDRLALMRLFQNQAFANVPQPPMLYMKKPFSGSEAKKKPNTESCELEILNVSRAAAEAIIIKTAWAILSESGCTDMRVEINSIGDKESFARFERDLHAYFRKNIHTLSGELRQKCKENNLSIFSSPEKTFEKEDEVFLANAPKAISSLSEASREHFKEVLEFLECLEVPYQINSSLMPNKNFASHTIFEIRGCADRSKEKGKETAEMLLCSGGRYNYLAKRAGHKRDVPAVGAHICYPKVAIKKSEKKIIFDKIKPARFYLVQLGNMAKLRTLAIVEAKLKSLKVIEMLRQENIPIYHSLVKENIGGQMAAAEYLKVSHLLIVGQKEAIENSVVVRSVDVRDQETVQISELPAYLRKILKKS